MRRRGLIEDIIKSVATYWVAQVMYVTGLTLLIPIVFFMLLPDKNVNLWVGTQPILILVALALVGLSFLIIFWQERKIGQTLKSLGLMTLMPGVAGLLLGILGRASLVTFFRTYIFGFSEVEPLVNFYLDHAIPKIMLLTISFLFLGILMWLMGDKVEKNTRGWL